MSRISSYMRRAAKRYLTHKCDYIRKQTILLVEPDGDPILDEWGQKQYTDEEIVEELPCLFIWKDVVNNTTNGDIIEKEPVLYTMNTAPLVVGDVVVNIRTKSAVILAKSGRVNTMNMNANMGEPTLKQFSLVAIST